MKPVQHEHTLEIKVPESLNGTVEQVRDHLGEHKSSYLFGLGGIVVGFVASRLLFRSSETPTVIVNNLMLPTE